MDVDVKLTLDTKKFPPDLSVEPWIVSSKLELKDFHLKHISSIINIEGEGVVNLGNDLKGLLNTLIKQYEEQVTDRANQAIADAVGRTARWAERCRAAHSRADQALFGIVQGGPYSDLRAQCAAALVALDFDGYAIGGVSVGEERDLVRQALDVTTCLLPADRPRYLMGVGRPQDILDAVATGIDLFDCVMPTRNGRNATCFTEKGYVRLRNASHRLRPRA